MKIERVSARGRAGRRRAAERAAHVLAAGGLVVHPTETVYGIGGDASARSNALIARVKGREAERGLILLVSSVESARSLLPGLEWTDAAQALAERFWPGPLSIIVPCRDAPAGLAGPGGGVGLRATPDPVARAILAAFGAPITSSSANRTGVPPARTADDAARLFDGREDLGDLHLCVVDGGPRLETAPSTVVSLVGPRPRVVREGPISAAEIARALERTSADAGRETAGDDRGTTYNILFVCTGNTCRSPMAAAIARRAIADRGLSYVRVDSAGTGAVRGEPAAEHAVAALREIGLDLSGHESKPLTADDVESADLIVAMGPGHAERVRAHGGPHKVFLLTEFLAGSDAATPIEDPFGGGLAAYLQTRDQIRRAVDAMIDHLAPILAP